jgi:hypothetical protein
MSNEKEFLTDVDRFSIFQMLDQELNMTRRANRPFVPMQHQDYFSLQRQVQDMEQPIDTPKRP